MEPSDLLYLLRVRIPVPMPLFLGLLAFGVGSLAVKKLEIEGKGQAGCLIFSLGIAVFVGFLVYQAGYPLWPW